MIIPSLIRLPEGETLEIIEEAEGMFCIPNAYKGDFQEFFKGRLTPIHAPEISAPATARVEQLSGPSGSNK